MAVSEKYELSLASHVLSVWMHIIHGQWFLLCVCMSGIILELMQSDVLNLERTS